MANHKKKLISLMVRHGDTDANDEGIFRSRLDPPLNTHGISQAEKAAENIKKEYGDLVKKVIASPMLRACQTGDILSDVLGVPMTQDRGIVSWALGVLQGKDRKEYQDILDWYVDHPHKTIPGGGESLDDFEERNRIFFDKELRTEGTIYVSHNSNCVALDNMVKGTKEGRPESSETSVEPGGVIGIYVDDDGKYYTEVLFGKEKQAAFGS